MLISQNVLALAGRMVQEDGAQPGKGLSYMKAIFYFGVIPAGIFLVITGLVLLGTSKKSKNSAISRID